MLSPSPLTESKLPTRSIPQSRTKVERGANPSPGADKSAESFIWRHRGKQCECPAKQLSQCLPIKYIFLPSLQVSEGSLEAFTHPLHPRPSCAKLLYPQTPQPGLVNQHHLETCGEGWGRLLCVCVAQLQAAGAGCAGAVCDSPARLGRESQKAGSQAWEKEGKRGWVGEEEGERKGQRQWCDLAKRQKG